MPYTHSRLLSGVVDQLQPLCQDRRPLAPLKGFSGILQPYTLQSLALCWVQQPCKPGTDETTLVLCCACSAKLEQAGFYLVRAAMGDAAVGGSSQHLHVFPAAAAADR